MRKPKINRKGDITWLKSRRCYNWHGLVDKYLLVFYSFTCDICQNEETNYLTDSSSNSLRKKPTFCDATTGYPVGNEISGGVEKCQLFTQAIPAITRLNPLSPNIHIQILQTDLYKGGEFEAYNK